MINFIWQLIKIGIGILLILGLIYILRLLILIYKASKKVVKVAPESICDTCKNLNRKGGGLYKYYCNINSSFDNPPEICSYYRKKSGD